MINLVGEILCRFSLEMEFNECSRKRRTILLQCKNTEVMVT